jgi:hypothetical protein
MEKKFFHFPAVYSSESSNIGLVVLTIHICCLQNLKRPSQYCLIHYLKQYLHVWSESSNIGLVVLAFAYNISKTTKPILLDSLHIKTAIEKF